MFGLPGCDNQNWHCKEVQSANNLFISHMYELNKQQATIYLVKIYHFLWSNNIAEILIESNHWAYAKR